MNLKNKWKKYGLWRRKQRLHDEKGKGKKGFFGEGKSYQIMGQSMPKKKKSEEKQDSLIDWLRDSEQIPEEGESIDEFIERTSWTLEEENKWREIDGLPLLKSEEEYRKLLEE